MSNNYKSKGETLENSNITMIWVKLKHKCDC